jgi:hypothetical protein
MHCPYWCPRSLTGRRLYRVSQSNVNISLEIRLCRECGSRAPWRLGDSRVSHGEFERDDSGSSFEQFADLELASNVGAKAPHGMFGERSTSGVEPHGTTPREQIDRYLAISTHSAR